MSLGMLNILKIRERKNIFQTGISGPHKGSSSNADSTTKQTIVFNVYLFFNGLQTY